ncbi:SusC/RagA family TonB-linked outer membrane protein [[Flexibacter] sp. ATCC 35208]|uniref:SusC/RagA family TonB-linked outer membrane protein n=1 Tax=[Flexibacter] sp. ATCC 35208 TaxID=1936242 RepID=UPI0009CCD625|nr:SusC/RagA family TonB-linked outer membrane protein [[Flexibacter] sp. ATCC 35208]OMP78897.1 SusC/RagA family TonB-linked outer membrane protein [[Flexibacter] sp. ATCC 35208]
MMRKLSLLLMVLLLCQTVFAQTRQLSGTVKDAKTGETLIAVTIKVKGKNNATFSKPDGSYTLLIPPGSVELEVSLVGYGTKTIQVAPNQSMIDLVLDQSSTQLGEVMVTALGITKESKKLGYSVSKVGGDLMTQARETNVGNSLTGRVAGLNVSGTSGGPGGSVRILLRGMASFSASSPLFVINGVPMDNTQRGSATEWGGADYGDGLSNINPDDIESMSVLKGASAAALYGSRAANGVILITTKTGKKNTLQVEYNSNFAADKAINFTDFQYEYGQGQSGERPTTTTAAQNSTRLAWGEKMDGVQTIQFDGNTYAYAAVKNNLENFYRTGTTFTNTVSASGGGDNGTFRLSLSDMNNKGILSNNTLYRKTIGLNVDQKVSEKLKVTVAANYIDEQSNNKPYLSDGPLNPNNGMFLAGNIRESILAPGYDASADGKEIAWTDDTYVTNPYFVLNQSKNKITRSRLISAMTARYDFTDWIYAQARVGYDFISDVTRQITPWGTLYDWSSSDGTTVSGDYSLNNESRKEMNTDALVGIKHRIKNDFDFNLSLGAALRKYKDEIIGVTGDNFIIPYLYNYTNVVTYGRTYDLTNKEAHSAYYNLDLSYKNFLTLTTTGRYDTYSTLPANNRNIFVPSVSGSFIFSELVKVPKMSYGKFRASWANASGEPTDAYITQTYYTQQNSINDYITANFSSALPNTNLKPYTLKEVETGLEVKFFDNRLGVDLAYFHRKTHNEIISGNLSTASGYSTQYIGTGSTQNQGVEILLTGTPVQDDDFSWNVSVNATNVKNKIIDIYGSNSTSTTLSLGTYRPRNAATALVKGMAGPQIMAYDYLYDDNGNIVVNSSGIPERGSYKAFGSVLPSWFGGINNDFRYKHFNFSFLVDGKFGNKVLSATSYYSMYRGLNKNTLEGREDGVTAKGVYEDGTTNTSQTEAQTYYQALAVNVSRLHVLDGSFIKLRQVTLGYSLNGKTLSRTPFSAINVSLVARNLLVLMKHTDNIDPEAAFSSTISYAGIEGTSLPSTRSYGINVNFKFKK